MPLAPRPLESALRPALPKGAHVQVTARSPERSRALPAHVGRSGVVQRVLPKAGGGWQVLVLLADRGAGTCREWYDAAELTFSGFADSPAAIQALQPHRDPTRHASQRQAKQAAAQSPGKNESVP